ncbi:MAG TPA: 4Fe-4S dicluster domain-containing protein [bacterium]|nr:4Fe-4S dicluster domain-containing protein [bacterium]HOL48904.1 4Fe-4S dicluster domain-containing protein [bacterium]HPQ19099.1 4Fe-4S dicluster domain-containing protein [bacterium]
MNNKKLFTLSKLNFLEKLNELKKEFDIYIPYNNGKKDYKILNEELDINKIELNGIRPLNNIKSLFFPSTKEVATYPEEKEKNKITKKRIIVGIKNCDLYSIMILDKIFLNEEYPEFKDIFYEELRENTYFISSDCDNIKDTCSCLLVNLLPYTNEPIKNCIMNITENKEDDLIIEIFENKSGIEFGNIKNEKEEQIRTEREKIRKKTINELEKIKSKFETDIKDYQELLNKTVNKKEWKIIANKCVQCHGCINGCPTCHCYLLVDAKINSEKNSRYKIWDSCYYRAYALMAGNITPRPDFIKRFQHRYFHKYDYFLRNINLPGCSGCGRCIETCMAKIDFRILFDKLKQIE